MLRDVSLSMRINLWEIFIKPLFDQLTHLFLADTAKTNQNRAKILLKYSFKRLTLLARSTPDKLIYSLSGYSLSYRAVTTYNKDEIKWSERQGSDCRSSLSPETLPAKCKAILPRQV